MRAWILELSPEEKAFERARCAAEAGNHQALYAALKRCAVPLSHEDAYILCAAAIRGGCTLGGFGRILEICPPLEEFWNMPGPVFGPHGLVGVAAAGSQTSILKYLLEERGLSPNRVREDCWSPLESALYAGAVGSVTVLCEHERTDLTVTERMRRIWALAGTDLMRDCCLNNAAVYLLGLETVPGEVPLLPGMTVLHGAYQENWPLVERICREGAPFSAADGRKVLSNYVQKCWELDCGECSGLLDALLTACPQLGSSQLPRYLLALCMLHGDGEIMERLRPRLERMPGREIVLLGRMSCDCTNDLALAMERWEERLGGRFIPVLRRDELLPAHVNWVDADDTIALLMTHCRIRGKAKANTVSVLAEDVLRLASPYLIARLCEEGILLMEEPVEPMAGFCSTLKDGEQKEHILRMYRKRDAEYEI